MINENIIDRKLEEVLKETCLNFASKEAIVFGEDSLTYEGLYQNYLEYLDWLQIIEPKEILLVKISNSHLAIPFIFSSISALSIPLFCDPVWTYSEILKASDINQANYLITDDTSLVEQNQFELIDEFKGYILVKINLQKREGGIHLNAETSFCRFTSGSTGFSRCLQFSEKKYLAANFNWFSAIKITQLDSIYCLSTLNNGLAFNVAFLPTFFGGATLILQKGSIVPTIVRKNLELKKPTIIVAFPFLYDMIRLDNKLDIKNTRIRVAISSAAPLSNESNDAWFEKFGSYICNYYGLAEVGPCTFNSGINRSSLGSPLPNVDMKIEISHANTKEGRILVKSNSMSLGFLDVSAPIFQSNIDINGYYVTNDLGYFNVKGELTLTGRVGEIINIAGRKIDPSEIENVIKKIPFVDDVKVIKGVVNQRELLVAIVESKNIKKEQIVSHCVANLSSYKIPQNIHILDKLPKSSAGKVSLGLIKNLI